MNRLPFLAVLCCSYIVSLGANAQNHRSEQSQMQHSEKRTWLGVATSTIHPVLREHLDLKEGFGVQITHVPEGSPAGNSEVKAGDVLTMVDDQRLTSPEHLSILIRSMEKGDEVELTCFRKGREVKTTVVLDEKEMPLTNLDSNFHRLMPKMPMHNASPKDWRRWQEGMREQQERWRREEMHKNFGKPSNAALSKPTIKNESTVKINNDEGSVVITHTNGKGEISIKDASGEEVYIGPYNRSRGIEALPDEACKHLEKMKVNEMDILSPK